SRGGGAWTRLMLGIDVKDPTGGFNAFRASTLRTINLATVDSAGYCFQLDMTWRVLKAGGVVAEVPITFVERERGASKMSKDIVVEAMAQTTRWGVEHRAKQVSHVADKLAGKTSEVIKQFRR
ncbi:dolichol-phosphate mannosyltransferase, partial [Cutibacterium acnes]